MIENDNLPFSKRYGFEPIEVPFQANDIDSILRTELWNAYYIYIYNEIENVHPDTKNSFRNFHKLTWVHYFKKALDDFPRYDYDFKNFIRNHIEKVIWYKIYEFFEFTFYNIEDRDNYNYNEFESYLNDKLRENNSAYILVANKFIPITNEVEIEELKKTQSFTENYGLTGIQEHLNSAIDLISQKPKPDYRNSIKESISMVEVISRIIEPSENTLGKALIKLDKHQKINPTLKAGFEKLYAYTNDKMELDMRLWKNKQLS